MENLPREQIELLIALAQRETEIDRIDAELAKMPVRLREMEAALQDFEFALETRNAVLTELKKNYRAQDADIQKHHGRIQKRDTQLRAVKNNKDYQAILKEISDIKTLISDLEDQTLECLEKIDAAEAELRSVQEDFTCEQEKIRDKQALVQNEADAYARRRDELVSERDHLFSRIDTELKKLYQASRSMAGKPAITEVRSSICLGCNMNIPPQMYNELHRGNTLRNCPHCHRLIYVI
jgi:predicted  nucleic acid-binding Zn-ribbon protein